MGENARPSYRDLWVGPESDFQDDEPAEIVERNSDAFYDFCIDLFIVCDN